MQFAMVFTFLTTILGPLVTRVLTGLGIGAVSYVGITALLAQVKSYMVSSVSGAPADALQLMGLAKLDIAFNIILSAVTARAVMAGMNAATGGITKIGTTPK